MSEATGLDPEQTALLGFIYRHCRGSPHAPATTGSFSQAYESLGILGLIAFDCSRHIWYVTETGEQLLRKLLG